MYSLSVEPLTIYLCCIDLSIDHPVGLEDNVSSKAPGWLLIWWQDGLPGHPEAQQHYCHHHHDEEHVTGLGRQREESRVTKKNYSAVSYSATRGLQSLLTIFVIMVR